MADAVDLSAFDKPAAPAAPAAAPAAPATLNLSEFDDPHGVSLDHFDQAQPPIETNVWNKIKTGAKALVGLAVDPSHPDMAMQTGQNATDAASMLGEKVMGSPVGSVLKTLNKPVQGITAGIVKGLDSTVSPGIKQQLNPGDNWFPDIAYHDVINYVAPTNDAAQAYFEKMVGPGSIAQGGRLTYATAKTGLGLAADIFADPLTWVGAGEFTQAGKAAEIERLNAVAKGTLTAEQAAMAPERYAVSLGAGNAKVGITTDQVSRGFNAVPGATRAAGLVSDAGSALAKSKPGQIAGDILSKFDYRTGVPEIDAAASLHGALKRGDYQYIYDNFVTPMNQYKFTPGETKVLSAAIEGTANDAAHADILKAVGDHSERLGVDLHDARATQLADAGVAIKAENAKDVSERLAAGLIHPGEDNLLENYLVHKMSPEARQFVKSNPEKAMAVQEALEKFKADKAARDSVLSTYDAGKNAREIKGTLEQANQIMKEKTGVNSWFIQDPVLATAMKRAETRGLVRDSELIERIQKYGTPRATAEQLGLKWKPLEIPQFKGALPGQDVVFAPKIADKIGYYIAPRETGNFTSMLDSFNRTYRNVALFKMDYYARNWNENLFKNWVQGVKLSDYNDVLNISRNKGTVQIGARAVPVAEIRQGMAKYGIDSGGQFREGVQNLLNTGKNMESDRKLARVVGGVKDAFGKAVNVLREGGESGENATRRALYVNRLKQGYSPAAAALEVEKYLFDYSRTSQGMDAARRFWNPFFQHAYKTLGIAPEMLATAPGKYNFLHNNMMQAIQASMNDPVTSKEVMAIIPQYQQIHDPIVGPILSGNSWLRRIFTNQTAIDNPGALGGKTAILFKNDIGMSILNQFAIFNDELGKSGGLVAPFMKSLAVIATGRDPFTLKLVDPTTQSADMARRFNYAMNSFVEGSVPMPETYKFVKQVMGFGDPKYYTPLAVQVMHAELGKFVTVTDLDKEYAFKAMALQKAKSELEKGFMSAAASERAGRTADIQLSDKPYLKAIKDQIFATDGSGYLYNKQLQNMRQAMNLRDAGAGLTGQMTASDIAKHLFDIDKTIDTMSKQYETVKQYRLEQLKNAPPAVVSQLAPGSSPQRAPQSLGRSPQSVGSPYIDPTDFETNIQRILKNPKLSDEEKGDRLDEEQQNLDDLLNDGSNDLGKDEYVKLTDRIQSEIQGVEGKKEPQRVLNNAPRGGKPSADPAAEGDEDKLLRSPRGTDAQELALRSRLNGVQRTNRSPMLPRR